MPGANAGQEAIREWIRFANFPSGQWIDSAPSTIDPLACKSHGIVQRKDVRSSRVLKRKRRMR